MKTNKCIFQNFNLTIEPNQKTELVWYNRVEKFTSINLLWDFDIKRNGSIVNW